ncbi:hypothetical protein Bbelb_177280 [Branchiostoma belcheri]|nr:hypothetical protein Bbelb_177280 [Branchiostoma belcheri]
MLPVIHGDSLHIARILCPAGYITGPNTGRRPGVSVRGRAACRGTPDSQSDVQRTLTSWFGLCQLHDHIKGRRRLYLSEKGIQRETALPGRCPASPNMEAGHAVPSNHASGVPPEECTGQNLKLRGKVFAPPFCTHTSSHRRDRITVVVKVAYKSRPRIPHPASNPAVCSRQIFVEPVQFAVTPGVAANSGVRTCCRRPAGAAHTAPHTETSALVFPPHLARSPVTDSASGCNLTHRTQTNRSKSTPMWFDSCLTGSEDVWADRRAARRVGKDSQGHMGVSATTLHLAVTAMSSCCYGNASTSTLQRGVVYTATYGSCQVWARDIGEGDDLLNTNRILH